MNIKEQIQKRGFTVSQVAALMTNKKGETYALLQKMYDAGYTARYYL